MDYAGLIFDESFHYLDHLAPFCALKKWPLIICEEAIARSARRYYPGLQVVEMNSWELRFPQHLVACDTRPILQAAFPHSPINHFFWLPHGNSDKGWKKPFFEALENDLTALVYGQKMIDFIHQKKGSLKTISIGNFRWRYFLENRDFYQNLLAQEIGTLLPLGTTNYLYAPTWEDAEENGSFWKAFPILADALPADFNLLIKLHPNTCRRFGPEIEALIGRCTIKKNILFLPEFPPIYPLLSLCDSYIGDMSSIGYDFLRFDKPMFFLNSKGLAPSDPSLYLHQCGHSISKEQWSSLFQFAPSQEAFGSIRKKIYDYTFTDEPVLFEEIL